MVSFRERWLEAVDEKNSVLCAGLDPAEFSMGRGAKGLPPGTNKRDWALRYVAAVAPYCAAVKPNFQFWKGAEDVATLMEVSLLADHLGLVVIDDSKLADIGDTNEAGIYFTARRGGHAVTIAPYAGNMDEAQTQAQDAGIGAITMCLMSNPQYEREKNKLVAVGDNDSYNPGDIVWVDDQHFVRQFMVNANEARLHGLAGIVIGAPSKKNHLTTGELAKAKDYAGDEMLVLLPGVGAQGGEAEAIWKYFGANDVIVNVGRGLMFPDKDNSLNAAWAAKAEEYKNILNEKRNAA